MLMNVESRVFEYTKIDASIQNLMKPPKFSKVFIYTWIDLASNVLILYLPRHPDPSVGPPHWE